MRQWLRENRIVRWGGIGATLLIVVALVSYLSSPRTLASGEKYREIKIRRAPIASNIVATAVVQPQNRVQVKPPISGRVDDLLVKEGEEVKRGQILAWMSSSERAAVLDAARARGGAEVKEWESFYKPAAILAPIDGAIIQRNVQPGQSFSSSDSVFVLSDRLIFETLVDETDIARIGPGRRASIVIDAYPDKKLYGRVDHVAFDAKTINSITTYKVDVVAEIAPTFLRSGMTANVTFEIGRRDAALLVPTEAVRVADGHTTVQMAGGPREIKTGITDGKDMEVLQGLKENDVVLVPEIRWDEKAPSQGGLFRGAGG